MQVTALCRRFAPYLRPVTAAAACCLALSLAGPFFGIGLMWMVKALVDQVFVGGRQDLLTVYLSGYAGIILAKLALDYAYARLDAGVMARIELDLRSDLFDRLIRRTPGTRARQGLGDLLSHLSGDVGRTEYLIYSGPFSVATNVVSAAVYLVFLTSLSWKLTAAALLLAPLGALASARAAPRMRRLGRLSRSLSARWMSRAEERLEAAEVVHVFDAQGREAAAFRQVCDTARRAELRTVSRQAGLDGVLETVSAAGGLLVLAIGAGEIRSGALTVGALFAFVGSVGSLYGPARSLARAWSRFQKSAASAERLAALLDEPDPVTANPKARALGGVLGGLEFVDVDFAYEPGRPVLSGLSFKVLPGERIAVVGASGAGKSTIARLALRFLEPGSGAILLDGVDIRDLETASLRSAICAVFQEPHILRGSVLENLRYAWPEANVETAMEMAALGHARAFIEAMPGRHFAAVGPRGAGLSGGQRQRLALARALMADTPILFLDEATAAVDSETEELIQDALTQVGGRRTIITVAHRLSSVQRSDRVLVLDEGRIVESGSPEALLRGPSRCRTIFAAQLNTMGSNTWPSQASAA